MTQPFDTSSQGRKKLSKCLCSPLALRNGCSFRMHAQEISLHLSHTFSCGQENPLPWAHDLVVVSRCITQSPTRFLHLEVSTDAYQVHRVFCRRYRDAWAPGETQTQVTVMGTKWGSAWFRSLFFGLQETYLCFVSSPSWPGFAGSGIVLYPSLTTQRILTEIRAGIQYSQG